VFPVASHKNVLENVFVFSDIVRYNIAKTYNRFTLDSGYRSPSCIVLLTIFYGKDNMHDSFIILEGKSLI